jgi:hypothetical protein
VKISEILFKLTEKLEMGLMQIDVGQSSTT